MYSDFFRLCSVRFLVCLLGGVQFVSSDVLDASNPRSAHVDRFARGGAPGWDMPERFIISVTEMIWAPLSLKLSHLKPKSAL